MKSIITYSLCITLSLILIGAQLGPSYLHFLDVVIELQESGEENPVEDAKDAELEKQIQDSRMSLGFDLERGEQYIGHSILNFQAPCRDVLSPPPDLI